MTFWNAFEQFFKHKQLRLFEKLLGLRRLFPEEFDASRVKRILIVRQHDQLGDFLLSTPVFRALRNRFPSAYVAIVARKYTAALAQNNEFIDTVIPFYEHGTDWRLKSLRYFRQQIRAGYDLAIVLNTVSHSLTSDLIARFSNAPYILGPEHLPFSGTKTNFFYNLISPCRDGRINQSERNLDIVRYIGADTEDASENITLLQSEKEWAKDHLRAMGWDGRKKLVAVHPGAGKIPNRWPVENFVAVAEKLVEEKNVQIFLTWGPAEEDLGARFSSLAKFHIISTTENNIRRFAALLASADLLLCNDTGVTHVGAAVGTPLVAVFGPTDPEQWKPVGERIIAVRGKDGVCSSVSTDSVLKKASGLLE